MKIFVITTPNRKDYILEQCKLHNLNVEVFDAVIGKKLGLIPENYNKLEFPTLDVKLTFGGIGCALSHYVLWNLCKYLPDEEFFILEDDCIFCDDFENKFKKIYDTLPKNWEMAYVGWIPYGNDITPITIDNNISVRIPSATHAYIIKKSAIPKLIDSLHPISSPVDLHIINKALNNLVYYVFDPSLVTQKSYMNVSDIDWMSTGYNWELDNYDIKQNIYKKFQFGDGWYNLETNIFSNWKWSGQKFSFTCPITKQITLEFSSVIENELILVLNNELANYFTIDKGVNRITLDIPYKSDVQLLGVLKKSFVPSQLDALSKDNRELGICLLKIELNMTDILTLPLELTKLS